MQLPSRTLVLLDALQRAPSPHGLPGDLLSVEAAIAACERFGLGERIVAVLEAEQRRVQAAVAEARPSCNGCQTPHVMPVCLVRSTPARVTRPASRAERRASPWPHAAGKHGGVGVAGVFVGKKKRRFCNALRTQGRGAAEELTFTMAGGFFQRVYPSETLNT